MPIIITKDEISTQPSNTATNQYAMRLLGEIEQPFDNWYHNLQFFAHQNRVRNSGQLERWSVDSDQFGIFWLALCQLIKSPLFDVLSFLARITSLNDDIQLYNDARLYRVFSWPYLKERLHITQEPFEQTAPHLIPCTSTISFSSLSDSTIRFWDPHSDSKNIGDRYMMKAILSLQSYGLTKYVIKKHWGESSARNPWLPVHTEVLTYLITGDSKSALPHLSKIFCLNPEDALREIKGLPAAALSALKHLYYYGVRGEQLRNWPSGVENFTEEDKEELESLITKEGLPFYEAIEQVTERDTCFYDVP